MKNDTNKISNYLFYIVLLLLPCSLLILNHIWKNRENQVKGVYIQQLNHTKTELVSVKRNLLFAYHKGDFIRGLVDTSFVENQDRESKFFMDIFHNENHLVLFFPEEVCPVCIELEFKRLKKITKQKKVLLLTSKANKRFVKVLKIQHKCNFDAYYLNVDVFSQIKNEDHLPLYFISDGLTNSHFFITDKSQPKLTDSYLKYVCKHL